MHYSPQHLHKTQWGEECQKCVSSVRCLRFAAPLEGFAALQSRLCAIVKQTPVGFAGNYLLNSFTVMQTVLHHLTFQQIIIKRFIFQSLVSFVARISMKVLNTLSRFRVFYQRW